MSKRYNCVSLGLSACVFRINRVVDRINRVVYRINMMTRSDNRDETHCCKFSKLEL